METSEPDSEDLSGFFVGYWEGGFRKKLPGEERPPPYPIEQTLAKTPWYRRSKAGVSYPLMCVLTSFTPAVWLLRRGARLRRKRRDAGLCPSCGYDLRATPDRCPQCGEPSRPDRQ